MLEAQGLSCSHCCRSVHQRCYDKGVSVCTQARGWVQLLIVFNSTLLEVSLYRMPAEETSSPDVFMDNVGFKVSHKYDHSWG